MTLEEWKKHVLCISWRDKYVFKGEVCHNVWRVVGDIDFVDGRAKFTIINGSHVDIEVGQVERVWVTEADN